MIWLVDVKVVLSYQFLQQPRVPTPSTAMEESLSSLHGNKTQLYMQLHMACTHEVIVIYVEWLITGSITPTSLLHCNNVKQAGG